MAEGRDLVESFRSSREEAYEEIVAGAERVRRKAALDDDREALLERVMDLHQVQVRLG